MDATSQSHTVYIGVGSNVGDRLGHFEQAFEALQYAMGIEQVISSPIYETRPIGIAGPGNFYNAVFRLETSHDPVELLHVMQAIERDMGRDCDRSGPRPIDLDLLLYDNMALTSEELTIPHPRMHERSFVLFPLADLAPHFRHPTLAFTVQELCLRLPHCDEMIGPAPERLEQMAFRVV